MRANTTVGDLPGGSYGLRIGTEGDNPTVGDISILGNIWSDPTGTMGGRFINSYGDVDTSSIRLDYNLFWNGGGGLPTEGNPTPAADAHRVEADPLLQTDQSTIILPAWDEGAGGFPGGSTSIRQEFERLVLTYGALAEGSPAIDAADPAAMPADDILGRARDSRPDIGAFEYLGDVIPEIPEAADEAVDAPPDASVDTAVDAATDPSDDRTGEEETEGGGESGCGCRMIF